jgi:hypothetical protein
VLGNNVSRMWWGHKPFAQRAGLYFAKNEVTFVCMQRIKIRRSVYYSIIVDVMKAIRARLQHQYLIRISKLLVPAGGVLIETSGVVNPGVLLLLTFSLSNFRTESRWVAFTLFFMPLCPSSPPRFLEIHGNGRSSKSYI